MLTKKQAIALAKTYQWTAADAERAFASVDLKSTSEQELFVALLQFAGPELYERQRLQAAQKGQVTKKNKQIETIEKEYEKKISEYRETDKLEKSQFVTLISKIYRFAKPFGLEDPWIEALLSQYSEYNHDSDLEQGAA